MRRRKRLNKRRVIHTRVSESMEEELKEKAEALGLSVSNLVRNVLENTLGLVEDIVADGAELARSARGEAGTPLSGETASADRAAPIIAWQRAVLNLNAICSTCNSILPKGGEAAVAITDRPGPRATLCLTCLKELSTNDDA